MQTLSKIAIVLIVLAFVSSILILISMDTTKQLQAVEQTCGPLSLQHPYQGGINVLNTTSGITNYYEQGTFCTYDLQYHYDGGLYFIIPIVFIVTAVILLLVDGWRYNNKDTQDDDNDLDLLITKDKDTQEDDIDIDKFIADHKERERKIEEREKKMEED